MLATGVGCERVDLRLGPAPGVTPRETVTEDVPLAPGVVCTPGCVGGRRCERVGDHNECTPHWLPVDSPEVSNRAPRVGHFVVWTGSEVLVWGGAEPTAQGTRVAHHDGFRFDPWRGESRPLPEIAGADARFSEGPQTAIWNGRAMVVFGDAMDGQFTTGFAWSPAENRWNALSSSVFEGSSRAAVFTGSGVLFWGSLAGLDDTWRRVSMADVWSLNLDRPMDSRARTRHSSVWTGEEVIIWGGFDGARQVRRDGWRFSTVRRSWRPVPDAPAPRSDHAAVWTSSEMLVYGGTEDGHAQGALVSYVPAVDQWYAPRTTGAAPSPRAKHVAVWTDRGMLVWGGTSDGRDALSDGAIYDPWDGAWRDLPSPPTERGTARSEASAVWTGTEFIVIGGTNSDRRLDHVGWRYQP